MQIEHDTENSRFVVYTESNDEAELRYTIPRTGVLDLQHTFVPPAMRGQDIADALAEHAFDYAREHDQKIVPSCSFIQRWLASHPDRQVLVAE